MKNLRFLVPLVLLLGAGLYLGYYYIWLDDEERVIHGKVDELVELANKEGDESVFVGVGTARNIAEYFSEEFSLNMGRPFPTGTTNRDELTAVVTRARGSVSEVRLRTSDRELEIDPDGERAVMELTGHGNLDYQGSREGDARRFRIEWVKDGGDWLIRSVELVERQNP